MYDRFTVYVPCEEIVESDGGENERSISEKCRVCKGIMSGVKFYPWDLVILVRKFFVLILNI